MVEGDGQDDPDVRESVDSFRKAGAATSDGVRKLYGWSRAWFERRRLPLKLVISLTFWFGGNWTYNRMAPHVVEAVLVLLHQISSEVALAFVFDVLENRPVLVSGQILTFLLAFVIAQNRRHTQKLKKVESKLTTMSGEPTRASDGGTRELPPTGPRAIFGTIAGGAIGITFGPGGLLAGMFLGFVLGDKRDIRAYERDLHTPELKAGSRPEQ